ncbi:DUF4157 domain-containing protein [Aquimarina sp. AU119]|uniref:eCIS core domain-containing protein n=1 Tax=Aquimarina sp. AU119 TaxID=2108528 RepID=UPI000D6921BF|nr:DUF4157 domain-containing protein [Aquimarina sp. AU119]
MKTPLENTQEPQQKTIQRVQEESSTGGEATIADNRPAIAIQHKLRSVMGSTEGTINPIQRKNKTGLPDRLKSGIENLSGYSMDDVKVHYNSNKPAQLQAHAYAQGTDIHLAPGQQKHLPHEAWHVVQQKQGRVKPTRQLKSKVPINDDAGLEKEADVMGAKALQMKPMEPVTTGDPWGINDSVIQQVPMYMDTSRKVFQLRGEKTAVSNIYNAKGTADKRVARGNRRGSITRTKGDSFARLVAFRDYTDKVNPLKEHAILLAQNASILNPTQWYKNNAEAIKGWVARQSEIGNCGEFGSMLVEELLRNTNDQWVHKCMMYPRSEYDHAFVVTYPERIPAGATMPESVDKRVAIVADAWDGYKVMNVETFCDGHNAYNAEGLDHTNIFINSSYKANNEDTIVPIREGLNAYAQGFYDWYQEQLEAGEGNKYFNYRDYAKKNDISGTFGTDGSNIKAGFQDLRPMSALFQKGKIPYDDDILNARDWWTNPAGTFNVGNLNASGWSIFSNASRRGEEIQNTNNNKKFGQFLHGASLHEYLRLAEFSSVNDVVVKAANLKKLNDCIDRQSLVKRQEIYNLLDDTDLTSSLNRRSNNAKVELLNGIQDARVTNYLKTQVVNDAAKILNKLESNKVKTYLEPLSDDDATRILSRMNNKKMQTYLITLEAENCAKILDQLDLKGVAYYFKNKGLKASVDVLEKMSLDKLKAYVHSSYSRPIPFFNKSLFKFIIQSNFPYKDQIIEELPVALAAEVLKEESEANRKSIMRKLSKDKSSEIENEIKRLTTES